MVDSHKSQDHMWLSHRWIRVGDIVRICGYCLSPCLRLVYVGYKLG